MVRRHLDLASMIYRLEFGHMTDSGKINPNTGKPIRSEFKPEFVVWASKSTLTQTELVSLAGANIKDAVKFLIRHNDSVNSEYTLRLNNKLYSIDLINYGNNLVADAYDRITCHRIVMKHG